MTQERRLLLHKGHKIPQTSNLQLAYSSMMSKTAVQKKTDYRSSLRGLRHPLGVGGGLEPPKPKPSYVPALQSVERCWLCFFPGKSQLFDCTSLFFS